MRINPINNTAVMPHLSTQRNNMPHRSYISEPVNEPKEDAVSFKGLFRKKVRVDLQNAKFYAEKLAASTPERKAIYTGGSLLKDEVKLISLGIAGYVTAHAAKDQYNSNRKPVVMIGGDEAEQSKESIKEAKNTLRKQGISVIEIKEPVPAPMLEMAAKETSADLSVLMTTAHDYWNNGYYNLITKDGRIAPQEVTKEVADNIEKIAQKGSYKNKFFKKGHSSKYDPYNLYRYELMSTFIDWNKIRDSELKVYYDGFGGTGNSVVPKLFNSFGISCTEFASNNEIKKNLNKNVLYNLVSMMKSDTVNPLKIGIANNYDSDDFAIIDENGNFISHDDVLLLIGYHLAENRGQKGAVIRTQSTSSQLDRLADKYGLKKIETPVGFEYISKDILKLHENNEDILVAGDGIGGVAVKNHIPDKDGILAASLIMDLIAEEGKPISKILKNVKQSLGKSYAQVSYSIDLWGRKDAEETMNKMLGKIEKLYTNAVDLCEDDLGDEVHTIDNNKTEALRKNIKEYKKDGDGIKLILTDGSSIFVRPDPIIRGNVDRIIRCYIDAAGKTPAEAKEKANDLKTFVDELFAV